MTRKSKQAGGNKPLSHYERTKKFRSSEYGTTTARLSRDSQLVFGDCSLSLTPTNNPVATPSGYIYDKEAILEYLVTKRSELKKARENYERHLAHKEKEKQNRQAKDKEKTVANFEALQKATTRKRSINQVEKNSLERTSYWLAEFQPTHNDDDIPPPPPTRPASPHSGRALRHKDLKPLLFKRQNDNKTGQITCHLSDRAITTQPVVALPGGQVILKECFDELVKPTMVDPFTSKPIREKDILTLVKARSGFAGSGSVQATKYRPTMT